MSADESLEWLEGQLSSRIGSFRLRREENRVRSFKVSVATTALSAVTAFFIATGEVLGHNAFSLLALATTSTATIVASIDGFYAYRARWLDSNNTLMKLYALQSDIDYTKAKLSPQPIQQDLIEGFYRRYSSILQDANESWFKVRKNKDG